MVQLPSTLSSHLQVLCRHVSLKIRNNKITLRLWPCSSTVTGSVTSERVSSLQNEHRSCWAGSHSLVRRLQGRLGHRSNSDDTSWKLECENQSSHPKGFFQKVFFLWMTFSLFLKHHAHNSVASECIIMYNLQRHLSGPSLIRDKV